MEYSGVCKTKEWKQVSFYVMPFQLKEVDYLSSEMGITRAEFIRQAIANSINDLHSRGKKNAEVC